MKCTYWHLRAFRCAALEEQSDEDDQRGLTDGCHRHVRQVVADFLLRVLSGVRVSGEDEEEAVAGAREEQDDADHHDSLRASVDSVCPESDAQQAVLLFQVPPPLLKNGTTSTARTLAENSNIYGVRLRNGNLQLS